MDFMVVLGRIQVVFWEVSEGHQEFQRKALGTFLGGGDVLESCNVCKIV